MTPTDDFDLDLLKRYLSGNASPEECERADQWLATNPARREVLASLRRFSESEADSAKWDAHVMYDDLMARIRAGEGRQAGARTPRLVVPRYGELAAEPARRWLSRYSTPLAAAAAVLLAVAAGVLGHQLRGARTMATVQPAMREFATARGERAEVRLKDRTRVLLGPATTLRVPADFGGAHRTVYLEGEAFFEVTHDSLKPFDVHAGSAVARDLGTKFSVTAYRGVPAVQVVVSEGAVALGRDAGAAAPATLLRRGDLGRLAATGDATVMRDVDLDQYLDWTAGRLAFRNTPLRDAIPRLERWYDVRIVLADSAFGDRRLTATFKDEAVPQVLDALALLLGTPVQWDGKTATLTHKLSR